jgi:hypothetical protein
MLRNPIKQRSATSSQSAVELLDRTGIIAASLPQRRRRAGEVPEPAPIYTRPPVCDQDLRPKSVVIRRRVRTWLGSGAAVLLIGLGWVAGSSMGGGALTTPADEVAQVDPNPAVAADPVPQPQPAPQPVVVQPQTPVTVYVPVPEHKASPKRVQSQSRSEADVPRVDLPPASTPQAKPDPVAQMLQPWVIAAEQMARSYDTSRR